MKYYLHVRAGKEREKKQERAGAHSFQGRRERTELKMLNSPTDIHSSFHGIINVWLGEVGEERPHALLVRSFCLVALERGGVKGASSFLLSFASLQEDPPPYSASVGRAPRQRFSPSQRVLFPWPRSSWDSIKK